MHHQLFPASFFFLFIIFFFFFFILPGALCVTDEQYSNCSRRFECGNIQNVSYPFWGSPQPSYCGLPQFKLECQDGSPVMEIMSERYRVVRINHENQFLTIAKMDYLDSTCPLRFVNTTLHFLFYYTPRNDNLTLFYGCSSRNVTLLPNQFSCHINDTTVDTGYFIINSIPSDQNLVKCNNSVVVPVLQTAALDLKNNLSTLSSVLNEGFEVQWTVEDTPCMECTGSGGQCGYNLTSSQPICFCPDHHYLVRCPTPPAATMPGPKVNVGKKVVIAASIAGVCIVVMTIIFCSRMKSSLDNPMAFWKKKAKNAQHVEAFFKNYGSLGPKRYSSSYVKKMTDSFKDKLGQGGYGSVYKGKLLDGRLVAVKVLNESKDNGEEFINEVVIISRTSHVNIVTFLGFCFEGPKRALIYEFMPNGSLEKFIYDEKLPMSHPPLGWKRLYLIAGGIARGLEYLHRGCNTRILHLDIKPHNILLDQEFCPKISDFGLAKLCPKKESIVSMMGARGTVGYIAPELLFRNIGGVSHKSDVYSYGMMVLEMVGGTRNIEARKDDTDNIYFPHWIHMRLELDEDLELHGIMTEEEEEIARKMILVSLWCTQTDPSSRPSMSRVVEMLEGSIGALQVAPKPFPSSPSRSLECSSSTSLQTFSSS